MSKRILFMDWGIGGLSVYREAKRLHPQLSCIYVSDSGFTPYGKVPAAELSARVAKVISGFPGISQGVIACNAASTVIGEVRAQIKTPLLGMIEAGAEMVRDSGFRAVGVIGGARTIESGVFTRALAGIEVRERVAQPLSALIEAGEIRGARLNEALMEILAPLRGVEALLLACTHYPAIASEISAQLPGVVLLDPAQRVAQKIFSAPAMSGEPDVFFTTGSVEQSKRSALLAFAQNCDFAPVSL
jgi:glutamate racemase